MPGTVQVGGRVQNKTEMISALEKKFQGKKQGQKYGDENNFAIKYKVVTEDVSDKGTRKV